MWVGDLIFGTFVCMIWLFAFFAFDEIILKGYFATKLRSRFNVNDVK